MLVNKGEGIYTLMGMVSGMNRLVGSSGFLFAAFFSVWLGVPVGHAEASHCFPFTIAGPVSGLLFENYETHEYVDHLLVLHLKLKTPDNVNVATFRTSVDLLSDTCGETVSGGPLSRVITTPGSGLYSIRFTSSTHFDIWNDEINTKLVCESCSQDIPERPGYHEFVFKGITEDGLNQFYSTSYRIRDDAPDPPVLTETLATPPNCTSPSPIGIGLFDNYERAEYREGLLVYHFRLNTSFGIGGWRDSIVFHDANCDVIGRFAPAFGPTITPYSQYFSVRFTSALHFDVWNDETNQIENCAGCSVDIPSVTPGQPYSYISFHGESGDSRLASTPFPVVEPGPEPLDPVIIVPGILESWKIGGEDGPWGLDPILHTFDNLWDALEAVGYVGGRTLFFLGYDFRQSNVQTAHELKAKIAEVRAICGCTKVDLIAHSMGGLVSRQYIQSDEYADDVDQMIFLGTPHLGSPKAYLAWEGGELTTKEGGGFKLNDIIFEGLLKDAAHRNNFASIFDFIQNYPIISLQELLPVYDYIIDEASGVMRSYSSLYPQNLFLENLNASENLGRLFGKGVQFINIVGSLGENSTVGGYVTIPSVTLPKWEHGYPNDFYSTFGFRGMFFEDGDKTVPFRSTGGLAELENIVMPFDHQRVVSKAQQVIVRELTGNNPSQLFDRNFFTAKALIIQVFSPISIAVTDPEGRTIGTNINDIPGAFYTGPGDEQFLVILDPIDGRYQMNAVGIGSGEYEIVTNFLSDTQEASTTVSGTALPDLELNYTLNVAADAVAPIEIESVDSSAPVTTAFVDGTSGENGWLVSDTIIMLSADDSDGVGVAQTEYSLDGGIIWQVYTEPIILISDGHHEILYRSEDFVDNQEENKALTIRIDTTPPEAIIHFDPGHRILQVEGIDVSSTTVSKNGKIFTIRDEAGHWVSLNFSKLSAKNSDIFATLAGVQYEGMAPFIFKVPYTIEYSWKLRKSGEYKKLTQEISAGKKELVEATYKSDKGKTVIIFSDKLKQEVSGIAIIKLQTNKGIMEISL